MRVFAVRHRFLQELGRLIELSGCSSAPVPPFGQGDQHARSMAFFHRAR
jgi:hypothetical protein